MNILAAVVVQIIGLAVLRTEPQLGGMHVILPSVTEASNVEPHSALLVYKNDARVPLMTNWPGSPFPPMPGYSYVNLEGKRIQFIVYGENAPAEIPAGLPHLQASCPQMEELSAGYQPPEYGAAAAVVLIPKGLSSACRNAHDRIDTQVRICNTGNFQIAAGCERITLRDDATVMIVNLPTAWVEATVGTQKKHDVHSQVYFHMAHLASEARHECVLKRSEDVLPCNSPLAEGPVAKHPPVVVQLVNTDGPVPPPGFEKPNPDTTFECSNTQWP